MLVLWLILSQQTLENELERVLRQVCNVAATKETKAKPEIAVNNNVLF